MKVKFISCNILLIVLALLVGSAQAVPNLMSYQGKLNDNSGMPLSGSYSMTFTIYDAPTEGNMVWSEAWAGTNLVNVTNGIFTVLLGSVQPLDPIVFDSDGLYLGIKVETDNEMVPRQRITSGTYAFKSNKAKALDVLPVPIGTFLPWAKNMTGVPVLPYGWVECGGQVLADPDSPLNGEVIPNLNAENRFLRGNSSSGSTGGSTSHRHSITLTQPHDYGGEFLGFPSDSTVYTNNTSTLPPYYDVVWIIKVK